MPPDEVTAILRQAALALQAAHEAGVVHRDVKPANIVVDPEGYAKLTDFGIARALGEASHDPDRRGARHPALPRARAGAGPRPPGRSATSTPWPSSATR